jgi:hypothetical protein
LYERLLSEAVTHDVQRRFGAHNRGEQPGADCAVVSNQVPRGSSAVDGFIAPSSPEAVREALEYLSGLTFAREGAAALLRSWSTCATCTCRLR